MEIQLIDMPKFVDRMEGDRELIREVFEVFIEEAPGRRDKFEKALAGMDLGAMIMLAHSLKGASSTLQADPLREASHDLERAARAGDEDKVRKFAPRTLALLERTVGYMEELKGTI